jgi:L-lactate dehydrogenase
MPDAALLSEFAGMIKRAPGAVVIVMTNPVDVTTYLLHKLSGLPARRFIGFSLNDTIRLNMAVGAYLNVPAADVESYVIG